MLIAGFPDPALTPSSPTNTGNPSMLYCADDDGGCRTINETAVISNNTLTVTSNNSNDSRSGGDTNVNYSGVYATSVGSNNNTNGITIRNRSNGDIIVNGNSKSNNISSTTIHQSSNGKMSPPPFPPASSYTGRCSTASPPLMLASPLSSPSPPLYSSIPHNHGSSGCGLSSSPSSASPPPLPLSPTSTANKNHNTINVSITRDQQYSCNNLNNNNGNKQDTLGKCSSVSQNGGLASSASISTPVATSPSSGDTNRRQHMSSNSSTSSISSFSSNNTASTNGNNTSSSKGYINNRAFPKDSNKNISKGYNNFSSCKGSDISTINAINSDGGGAALMEKVDVNFSSDNKGNHSHTALETCSALGGKDLNSNQYLIKQDVHSSDIIDTSSSPPPSTFAGIFASKNAIPVGDSNLVSTSEATSLEGSDAVIVFDEVTSSTDHQGDEIEDVEDDVMITSDVSSLNSVPITTSESEDSTTAAGNNQVFYTDDDEKPEKFEFDRKVSEGDDLGHCNNEGSDRHRNNQENGTAVDSNTIDPQRSVALSNSKSSKDEPQGTQIANLISFSSTATLNTDCGGDFYESAPVAAKTSTVSNMTLLDDDTTSSAAAVEIQLNCPSTSAARMHIPPENHLPSSSMTTTNYGQYNRNFNVELKNKQRSNNAGNATSQLSVVTRSSKSVGTDDYNDWRQTSCNFNHRCCCCCCKKQDDEVNNRDCDKRDVDSQGEFINTALFS